MTWLIYEILLWKLNDWFSRVSLIKYILNEGGSVMKGKGVTEEGMGTGDRRTGFQY